MNAQAHILPLRFLVLIQPQGKDGRNLLPVFQNSQLIVTFKKDKLWLAKLN